MHKYALVLGLLFVASSAFARPIPTAAERAHYDSIARQKQALQKDDVDFDYSGQARLPGCSGSVVSFGQADTAKAVLLTNGHCIGMMEGEPNAVIVNEEFHSS